MDKPAHLARSQSQPGRDRVLLELSVDKSLNALEPIQFAHRHGHLGYPDHGQSPRPSKRSAESGPRGPKRTFLLSGKRTSELGCYTVPSQSWYVRPRVAALSHDICRQIQAPLLVSGNS